MKIRYKIIKKIPILTHDTKLKEGDRLLCNRWNGHFFTAGKEYLVLKIEKNSDGSVMDFEVINNKGQANRVAAIIQTDTEFIVKSL